MTSSPSPRPRRYLALFFLVLVTAAASACGDGATAPEPDPVVSGSWSGTSQGLTLRLTLSEGAGGAVSGSGNITGGTDNLALTVRQGTHTYPSLSLILGAQGFEDLNFAGTLVSETQIAGTLNGSGFDNFNFNLSRQ
ncbi:MAG: hypothetical protein RJQ04_03380 [Longimicrobiales bacterium]